MRKKPWLIGTAIGLCAVLLAGYAGASMGLWRGERPFTEDWAARQRSADDADWSVLEQGQAVLENERFRFELQADTTHFTVTDRATGRIYRSVPEETVDAGELADRAFSEVSIQYYNDQSQPQEMHSTPQGVEAGGATVKQGGDAVRVYYTIGEKKSGWAPLLIARSVYEDALLDTLSASEKRRMNRYYSLMEPGAEDFEEKAQTYPCLREGDYYLLTDDLQDRYLEEIAEYLQRIGYTQEAYAKDCEAWGLPAPADGDDSPAFELAVEYRLTADGFSAGIFPLHGGIRPIQPLGVQPFRQRGGGGSRVSGARRVGRADFPEGRRRAVHPAAVWGGSRRAAGKFRADRPQRASARLRAVLEGSGLLRHHRGGRGRGHPDGQPPGRHRPAERHLRRLFGAGVGCDHGGSRYPGQAVQSVRQAHAV